MDFTRENIVAALTEMGEALHARRKIGDIAVFDGSAMILQFDVDFITHDVDAVIDAEHGAVIAAVQEVARRRNWPSGWLNEGVSVYLSPERGRALELYDEFPSPERVGLRIYVAKPEYLLAMKLQALRTGGRDVADVMTLAPAPGSEDRGGADRRRRPQLPERDPRRPQAATAAGHRGVARVMRRPKSLAEVAERRHARADVPLWLPLSEFLDAFYEADAPRKSMLAEEPSADIPRPERAYLAGAAEHLSALYRLEPPEWVAKPAFFLTEAYWPETLGPAFEQIALAESPVAFRRRFIFTEAQPLRRKGGPRRHEAGAAPAE